MSLARIVLLLLVMLCVAIGSLWTDEAADHAALRQIRTLYEEVVRSDDITQLLPYLPENLTAVTPTGEEIRNPQQLQAYFHKIWGLIGKAGSYQAKVNVTSTDFYGDLAVSYGTTDELVRTAAGKTYQFPMLWTAIIRKDGEQWKVIRMHGSIDPLTNVFVMTQLRLTKWLYGVGGVVVGLGVGLLLRGWRRRRT